MFNLHFDNSINKFWLPLDRRLRMLVVAAFLFYIVVCCERYMEAVAALDPWCTVHCQRRHQLSGAILKLYPFGVIMNRIFPQHLIWICHVIYLHLWMLSLHFVWFRLSSLTFWNLIQFVSFMLQNFSHDAFYRHDDVLVLVFRCTVLWQAEDYVPEVVQLLVVEEARPHIFIETERSGLLLLPLFQTIRCFGKLNVL